MLFAVFGAFLSVLSRLRVFVDDKNGIFDVKIKNG